MWDSFIQAMTVFNGWTVMYLLLAYVLIMYVLPIVLVLFVGLLGFLFVGFAALFNRIVGLK